MTWRAPHLGRTIPLADMRGLGLLLRKPATEPYSFARISLLLTYLSAMNRYQQ